MTRPPVEPQVRIDAALLASIRASLESGGLVAPGAQPDLNALLGIRGVVIVEEPPEDADATQALQAPMLASLESALTALLAMRNVEGSALAAVLRQKIDVIEALTTRADALPSRRPEAVRQRLEAAVTVLKADHGLDPARLHQEALLAAARRISARSSIA